LALTPSHPLRFLALCARPELDDELRCRLATAAATLEPWDLVVLAAEYHEIAGLLYSHLKAAGVQLPRKACRTLEGFVARTRHATRIRLQVLAEVLEIVNTQGIETLVLKGGALALTLYREPAHRPLADLDLWVAPERIEEAQATLLRQGYAIHPAHGLPEHRHLPPVSRELDGIRVMVELHRTIGAGRSEDPAALLDRSIPFEVGEQPARTLGPADMLAQLHSHLVYHLVFHRHLRLKWVADLIGIAERYAETLDWAQLRTLYPAMPGALAMLHPLSPLSEQTRIAAGISTSLPEPPGIDEEISVIPQPRKSGPAQVALDFQEWPDWLLSDARRSLIDTLLPTAWRLRLFWGLDRSRTLFAYRWRYLLEVITFGREIWKSHGGSLATLSRRPWIQARLLPRPRQDNRG